MNSGWGERWSDPNKYRNADEKVSLSLTHTRTRYFVLIHILIRYLSQGILHFPGFTHEAVDFLFRERDVTGIGVDTLSIGWSMCVCVWMWIWVGEPNVAADPGASCEFAVHHLWLKK